MIDSRKMTNLTAKEQIYLNAKKYTDLFAMAKQSNDFKSVFRVADWLA